MQLLRELNTIALSPFELSKYDDMPRLVGNYRVRRHESFITTSEVDNSSLVRKLNSIAIGEIVGNSRPVTLRDLYMHQFGFIPSHLDKPDGSLDETIFEYNPKGLPPFSAVNVESDDKGRPTMKVPMVLPIPIEIDGQNYAVDTSSFGNEYFDEETGMTVEELLSD